MFNWTATLYRGSITFQAPMLFSLGFMVLFTVGGVTGLFLATLGTDIHLHDTYFVVAHFHFVMVGGMVLGYYGGAALLVAEDDRADVFGLVEPGGGVDHHSSASSSRSCRSSSSATTACRGGIRTTRRSSRLTT